ncbi:hypothetical protein N9Z14_00340 [Opitutales bacterium]|nr:hypothetical protein [Opitutales bacterium]
MKVPYSKKWLSVSDQLQKLKDGGLKVEDPTEAEDFLRHLNYYRFSGYGLAFETRTTSLTLSSKQKTATTSANQSAAPKLMTTSSKPRPKPPSNGANTPPTTQPKTKVSPGSIY